MAGLDAYTKLLINANSDFTDASASAHTPTLHNTPTIDTSIKVLGAGAGKFVAASAQDVLYTGTLTDFNFGTGDFTVDGWFRTVNNGTADQEFLSCDAYASGLSITLFDTGTTNIRVSLAGTALNFTFSSAPSNDTWYHLAVVRWNSKVYVYKDGVVQGAGQSNSSNITGNTAGATLGNRNVGGSPMSGYLDAVRVTKGLARWIANFTPPASEFTADGSGGIDVYTRLLAHFDNDLTDSGFYNNTISSTGAGSTRSAAQSKFGGYSQKFDGTTAYLSTPLSTLFDFSADFTIDCWIYTGDKSQDTQYREVWNNGASSASADWMAITINPATGGLYFITADTVRITGTTAVDNSAWHHVAISRTGSSIKLFVDGVQDGSTYTSSQDFTRTSATFYLGIYADSLSTGRWNGYIDEFRVSCGIGRYTGTFTPASAAYSTDNTVYMPSFFKGNFMQPDCSRGLIII